MENVKSFISRWGCRISPAVFGIAVLCFLLPFVGISCNGQPLGKAATGFDIVTGSAFEKERAENEKASEISGGWLVPVALAFVIAAGIFAFAPRIWGTVLASGFGIAGAVALLLFRWLLNRQINAIFNESSGNSMADAISGAMRAMITVDYRYGFWLVIFLVVLGVAVKITWERWHKRDVIKGS